MTNMGFMQRSPWFTALLISLILNGLFLWLVQALTFFKAPGETKDYFPVEVVRLDTPPALRILKPQIEKPMIPIPVPQKPVKKSEPPPVSVKQDVTPPMELTPPTPQPQEIGLDEKAPPEPEPSLPVSASTASVNETTGAGATASGDQAEAGGGVSAVSFVPISRLTKIPGFSRRVEPVYPEKERMTSKESSVLAEVDLDEKGSIIEIRIIQSGGKAFDLAVEAALRKSLLTPGYIKDNPVPVRVQIPFVFRLR